MERHIYGTGDETMEGIKDTRQIDLGHSRDQFPVAQSKRGELHG